MAVKWRPLRKKRCVEQVLEAHPVDSGRCAEVGELLHMLACTQDARPKLWLLRPSPYCGPCLLPKIEKPSRWTYHVCLETEIHCVCALSGAGGTPSDRYIRKHFQYPDGVVSMKHDDPASLFQSIAAIP